MLVIRFDVVLLKINILLNQPLSICDTYKNTIPPFLIKQRMALKGEEEVK